MTVHTLFPPAPKSSRARVPLRVGDVWVYIGPATEFRIAALEPRPTAQKPWSQAVTLSDGRVITEATLRYAFQRKPEYLASLPAIRAKWNASRNAWLGISAEVITLRPRA